MTQENTTTPTDNVLPGEDILFWMMRPGCSCDTGHGPGHDPLPLICPGFGKTHSCGKTGIELQDILRCPACYPKWQKK